MSNYHKVLEKFIKEQQLYTAAELGCGTSSVILAENCKLLIAVDCFHSYGNLKNSGMALEHFHDLMSKFNHVVIQKGTALTVLEGIPHDWLDFTHIDVDDINENFRVTLRAALPKSKIVVCPIKFKSHLENYPGIVTEEVDDALIVIRKD